MATTAVPVTTEELFNAAVDVIRDLPKNGSFQPSNQLMLRFYGFYKQATEGPCQNAKPAFWDVVGRAKWGAWNKLGTMPKEEAMKSYIEELKKQILEMVLQRRDETALICARGLSAAEKAKIVETMAYTENIDRFMEVLEPFYEFLDIGDKSSEPEGLSNGHDYPTSLHGETNGNNNVENIKSIQNGLAVHKTKESLSEKYLSDSDSENEEYGDPIEAHVDDIKLLKQGLLDHNDNDSGYADHVIRDAQNGSDHALLDNTQNPLWDLYSNGKTNDMATPSPQHLPYNGNAYVDGDNDFLVREKLSPRSAGDKGLVVRGGGDENGATGGGSLGQGRGGQPPDIRGQGHRDNLNQPHMGLSSQRGLSAGVGGGGRGGPGRGLVSQNPDDISEQIAMALLRLQRDMDSVLARLNVLETVALAQHNTAQDRLAVQLNMQSQVQLLNNASRPSWWPFKELSCRTFFFILGWPIIFHLLVRFVANRRARRLLRKL